MYFHVKRQRAEPLEPLVAIVTLVRAHIKMAAAMDLHVVVTNEHHFADITIDVFLLHVSFPLVLVDDALQHVVVTADVASGDLTDMLRFQMGQQLDPGEQQRTVPTLLQLVMFSFVMAPLR